MRLLLVLALATSLLPGAELRLADVFSDHAVLQRDKPIKVWGAAAPGTEVEVELGAAKARAKTDAAGRWLATLPAQAAGGPFVLNARSGSAQVKASDLLVGEVWIASGQSNMEWTLGRIKQTEKLTANERIRIFVPLAECSGRPETELPGSWAVAGPGPLAAHCSAVAAYFAQRLQPELGVPVGVLVAAKGGTEIAEWMPAETWLAAAKPKAEVAAKLKAVAERDAEWATYREKVVDRARREQAGEKFAKDDVIQAPETGFKKNILPGRADNGFLFPVRDLAATGLLWYQGEYNAGCYGRGSDNTVYAAYFAALAATWRARWGELPILAVQLPNYGDGKKRSSEPKPGKWLNLQLEQVKALDLVPRHALVTTIDVGGSVHPDQKQPVGERLALAALQLAYGRKLMWSGPGALRATREGNLVRIHFDQAEGLKDADGGDLRGFAVQLDQGFQEVPARIDGTAVLVGPLPEKASAIVYAWNENPTCDLTNGTGIPARAFRLPLP